MDVASYCYYEKGCRTNALLKYFYSFSTAELNNIEGGDEVFLRNFHAKRVIFVIAMINMFNNCILGSLSNNYFPLNESPSLYKQCFVYFITAWKNTCLKNYSKFFNALILTPYSYPKQTTYKQLTYLGLSYWPYIQRFVACLLMYIFFYFPDFESTWRK